MKLDKIKFARLIAMIASEYKYVHDDFVQSLDDMIDINVPEPPPAVIQAIKPSDIDALLDAIFGDNKIEAIKQYRFLTGLPLKDSKVVIDEYWPRETMISYS